MTLIRNTTLINRPLEDARAHGPGAAVLSSICAHALAGLARNAALSRGLHALDGLFSLGMAGFLHASARRSRSRMAES